MPVNERLKILPERLLPWFAAHARPLPWRKDRDPYRVWVSEIMLQQTRVEAVKNYYDRFLLALPDVLALANAPEEKLMKLWEGLGYYSRARNLQKAAKQVAQAGGAFPDTREGLLALPGVGEYTAGAVASICFDRPCAAVDGNVLRVLSRFLADPTPIDSPACKRQAREALETVYPRGRCGDFTQALMELGATVCLPNGAPDCGVCPLAKDCLAHRRGAQRDYPKKGAKKARRAEERTVFLLRCGDALAMEKRPEKGLLAGLWQLPNLPGRLTPQEAVDTAEQWGLCPAALTAELHKTHIFTHMEWNMTGYEIRCAREGGGFFWATKTDRREGYALPTAFRQFLFPEEREEREK
ncbi:MAG: A/G-specific adenine glycosylase [Clostridia bacterium]|nr:A/G-specific adenine glycosylase [Clostridia bacterium]